MAQSLAEYVPLVLFHWWNLLGAVFLIVGIVLMATGKPGGLVLAVSSLFLCFVAGNFAAFHSLRVERDKAHADVMKPRSDFRPLSKDREDALVASLLSDKRLQKHTIELSCVASAGDFCESLRSVYERAGMKVEFSTALVMVPDYPPLSISAPESVAETFIRTTLSIVRHWDVAASPAEGNVIAVRVPVPPSYFPDGTITFATF